VAAAGNFPDFAPLRTERLRLRALRAEDAPALHRLVNDWEVAKTLARVPFPYSRDLADEWIASTREQIAAGEAWHLAVAGEDDALLGCAGVTLNRDRGRAELGYWIGRRHWGAGLGAEAAGRLAAWAVEELGVGTVHASVLRDNARSIAVLRRLGFREAGEGTQPFLSRGGGAMPVLLFEAGPGELATAAAAPRSGPDAGAAEGALLLVVACALVDPDGRVLLARRPEGKPMAGLWEFPGGKVHPEETPEAALIRELGEELGISVEASCLAPFTFASHPLGVGPSRRHLLMPLYLCRRWEGAVRAREGQALAWVRPPRLRDYAMPPADKPLVAMLQDFL
jgi:8-oxo-dGTP diphosphatase